MAKCVLVISVMMIIILASWLPVASCESRDLLAISQRPLDGPKDSAPAAAAPKSGHIVQQLLRLLLLLLLLLLQLMWDTLSLALSQRPLAQIPGPERLFRCMTCIGSLAAPLLPYLPLPSAQWPVPSAQTVLGLLL